jgi:hypothetical protein
MLSQLALMAIAAIPLKNWRSFRKSADPVTPTSEHFEFTHAKLAVETTPE